MPKTACTANISEAGIRQRFVGGMILLILSLAAAIALTYFKTSWYWRLVMIGPFWFSLLAYFSASHKT